MRLRRKTLLTVAALLTVMTLVIVAIASSIVMASALAQERWGIQKELERASSVIDSMGAELGRTVRDWAGWDDTYQFVQDHNQAYIDSNMADSTFTGLELNYILYFDNSFELVWGKAYDRHIDQQAEISPVVLDLVVENLRTTDLSHPYDAHNGLVRANGTLLLISVHAITDNTLTAPVMGSLVMARELDAEQVEKVSDIVQINTDIITPDGPGATGLGHLAWNDMVMNGTTLMSPVGDSTIRAFKSIPGINGTAAAVLQVQDSRFAVSQATSVIGLLAGILFLVSLAFCIITLMVTDRFTTRRVQRLSKQVSDIGLRGDVTHRVTMDGSDELSELADEVNKTLDAISTMEMELRDSERRYRAIVNDQTEMIFRTLDDGTITFMNDAQVKELYRLPKDLIGKNIRDVLAPPLANSLLDHLREVRETGRAVSRDYQHHHRVEGIDKWYSWSVRGIYGADGKLKEFQGVGRDMTAKKLAEEALGQANKKLNLLASITRHDVMNQLTIAHGFVSLSRLHTDDPRMAEQLAKAETALQSIQGHLEFTRDYQRMGMVMPVWIRLQDVLEKAATGPRNGGIEVHVDMDGHEILTDPLVERVFYNILDNSQRHGGGVRKINVSCRPVTSGLLLVFEDDGVGVSPDLKEEIFQAGYGNNTGYGLFLAREILSASGMAIHETGEPSKGARFEILVPPGRFRKSFAPAR